MFFVDTVSEVALTTKSLANLVNSMEAMGTTMSKDDVIIMKLFEDTVLLETEDISTIIKLERQ